jgi:hypothetical protein
MLDHQLLFFDILDVQVTKIVALFDQNQGLRVQQLQLQRKAKFVFFETKKKKKKNTSNDKRAVSGDCNAFGLAAYGVFDTYLQTVFVKRQRLSEPILEDEIDETLQLQPSCKLRVQNRVRQLEAHSCLLSGSD